MAKKQTPETETATTKQMSIMGVVVTVPQPYAAGHQITEAEAAALNQTLAENISNNRRKLVKEMQEAGAAEEKIVAMVEEYAATYEFTLASVGSSTTRMDPLTREAYAIARDYLNALIKEQGMTVKAYKEAKGEDTYSEKLAAVAANEQIIAMARKRLDERKQIMDLEI